MKTVKPYANLLRRLRNGDHFEFYREIIKLRKKSGNNLGEILKPWGVFIHLFQKEDDIFKRSLKAPETEEINKLGRQRMNVFRRIKLHVRAARYNTNPAEHAAAVALTFVLHNFKEIPTTTTTQASALFFNLIEEFRRPKYAPHVATLGLAGAVDELEATHDAFLTIFSEREQRQGAALRKGNMKKIRPLVDKAFAAFVEALNAFYATAQLKDNPAEIATYGYLIDGINSIVHYFNNVYAHIAGAATKD
ncbi:MAG: DUF6261 family protein [Tannerellaceae bacterium]|jgi:hypothetical protein|nr:DUF6261 family protein [Tannerellaceae bacterium]